MSRSQAFHHTVEPWVELIQDSVGGSLPFLAPTAARLVHRDARDEQLTWNARHHRKQRHRAVSPRHGRRRHIDNTWARIARLRLLEYWNVSWWVAVLFTSGSVVWVINGFQVFLPFVTGVTEDPVGSGWSAWVGATIFEIGSILLILEAWNRDDVAHFGYAVAHALEGERRMLEEKEQKNNGAVKDTGKMAVTDHVYGKRRWVWWSTDPKYWREFGFVAGFSQLCGASIFWISGFTALPQIQAALQENRGLQDGIFWVPQVVGGTGFIISSTLYMLEAQKKWYIPALNSLGWHVGFWNFIGGIGFTLCGAFGFSSESELKYQSSLSTFWGGWAFLIGSVIQWYEAVNPIRQATALEHTDPRAP